MKVKDLIAKLGAFDPELPVCLADWTEQCVDPSEDAAETVALRSGTYIKGETFQGPVKFIVGQFVCLGEP